MYEPTYWNHKGRYQKEYEILSEILIPVSGNADTKQGQLLLAISNFYYERYNNGFFNSIGIYTNYIRRYAKAKNLDIRVVKDMSERELDKQVDKIMEHLLQTLVEPCTEGDKIYRS